MQSEPHLGNQSQTSKVRISAFLICCNEDAKIRRCLESIRWCDEIVIVDSGSKDKTLEICREYTTRIFHRDWTGFVDQKQFGLEQCTADWVLNVDSDEVLSGELRTNIESRLAKGVSNEVDGFLLSRVVFFQNKWWRKGGWYPEYRLRLLRKSKTHWGGIDPHEKAIVIGKIEKLEGELQHYTYGNFSDQVLALNGHASVAAESIYRRGKITRVKVILGVMINPFLRFLKFYFLKKGFLEGFPGFLVAIQEGYYVFLKYAKIWEKMREKGASPPPNSSK